MEQLTEKQYEFAQATDVGCVRELNEDSIFASQGLWVVADGMGGHACGEVASALAIDVITSQSEQSEELEDSIQAAHKAILNAGQSDTAKTGMGTTVVAVSTSNDRYKVAWVGDSRVYLWDERLSKLNQITEDHSLMVRLINAGLISEKDAMTHPQRHMITQCLGSTEISEVKVDSFESHWDGGQQLLLCSDGLSDEVSDDMIAKIMRSNASLADKTNHLIELAKKAGGRDNISVIIIESPLKKPLNFIQKIKELLGR
jgi:protein phosphatase